MENYPSVWREVLKNKVIQCEESNIKESRRFGFNKPSSGLRKDVMKCRKITNGCLTKYKIKQKKRLHIQRRGVALTVRSMLAFII